MPRCFGNLHPQKTRPARFSRCNKCSKTGHWVQACKSSQPGKLFEVVEEESFLLGEIVDVSEVQSNSTKSLWTATILVETTNFKLNPFAPEPPVTARADPGPFYPL